ncbi:MAG: hypothetical protein ACRCX2_18500 [Paraclostridium sp.]
MEDNDTSLAMDFSSLMSNQMYADDISRITGALSSYAGYQFRLGLDSAIQDPTKASDFIKKYSPEDVSYLFHTKKAISPDDHQKYLSIQSKDAIDQESKRRADLIYNVFADFDRESVVNKDNDYYEAVSNLMGKGISVDEVFDTVETIFGIGQDDQKLLSHGVTRYVSNTLADAKGLVSARSSVIKHNKYQQKLLIKTLGEIDNILSARNSALRENSSSISFFFNPLHNIFKNPLNRNEKMNSEMIKSAHLLPANYVVQLKNYKDLLLAIKQSYIVT